MSQYKLLEKELKKRGSCKRDDSDNSVLRAINALKKYMCALRELLVELNGNGGFSPKQLLVNFQKAQSILDPISENKARQVLGCKISFLRNIKNLDGLSVDEVKKLINAKIDEKTQALRRREKSLSINSDSDTDTKVQSFGVSSVRFLGKGQRSVQDWKERAVFRLLCDSLSIWKI